MQQLLLNILRALVQAPEALEITETSGDTTTYVEIRCDAGDLGVVIGKNGKTISAIRTLMNATSHPPGRHVVVEVIEPEDA
jgi:predicted RNA-binding protein YlqC (UPF0109 family)